MARVGSDNLVIERGATVGLVLADGTYTAGTLVVEKVSSGEWSNTDPIDGTARVAVLLEDRVTASDGKAAPGALEGKFNLNKITFPSGQDFDAVSNYLQQYGIHLMDQIKEEA